MMADRAARSFAGIIALGAGPVALAGLAICVAMAAPGFDSLLMLDEVLALVLAVGFVLVGAIGAALGVRSGVRQWRSSRELAAIVARRGRPPSARVSAAARAQGLGHVTVVDDDDLAYAYTLGVRDPRVVLTTGLVGALNDPQLAAVLAHECYHVANRDPLRIMLARAIAAATPLVPATPALLDRYRVARELEADRWAIRRCGRAALAGALLATIKHQGLAAAPVAGFRGADGIDERLAQLEGGAMPAPPSMPRLVMLLSAVGVLALALGLLATGSAGLWVLAVIGVGSGALGTASVMACTALFGISVWWLRLVWVASGRDQHNCVYTTDT